MPAFQAINLEPEENLDDEVDTTRQLHIDDALKRFQNALKLHAQGPRFFDEANDAYDDLFNSDIFQYPEAATEFERAVNQPDQRALEASIAAGVDVHEATDLDNADSSLPQVLYLAHKNHGQFALDKLRHESKSTIAKEPSTTRFFERDQPRQHAHDALNEFNAALDRDPSDAELWRRTARVASFLRSARVSRYCLEASIELDDDPAVEEVEPPSLAEGLAGEELKEQLHILSDDIGLSHPAMLPWIKRRMPSLIKRHLDPIPFLPNPMQTLEGFRGDIKPVKEAREVIECSTAAWSQLGMALVRFLAETGHAGRAVVLDVPETEADDDQSETAEAIERQLQDTANSDDAKKSAPGSAHSSSKPQISPAEDNKRPDNPRKGRSESAMSARKRSQSIAGLAEPGEEDNVAEKRSKRIRRRETAAEEAIVDQSALLANQLAEYQAADRNLFQLTKDNLENLGITEPSLLGRFDDVLESCASEERTSNMGPDAAKDLRNTILSFTSDNAKILVNKKEASTLGMSAFLEHAKGNPQKLTAWPAFKESQGINSFVRQVNSGWMNVQDVAWAWVKAVAPSYLDSKWTDFMKTTVVQVISRFDRDVIEAFQNNVAEARAESKLSTLAALQRVALMLFELHLDIYERITNPNSAVDYSIRLEAKGRLARWLDMCSQLLRYDKDTEGTLVARFLWSAVFSTTLTDNASREYILQCWTSLRDFLLAGGLSEIHLQNNAVLSEVSPAAADREISKLTTMDFFLGLFQDDISDPVAIVENLEPVLNPGSVSVSRSSTGPLPDDTADSEATVPIRECASQELQDLWKFVKGTSTELRLFLWSRLSDAYGSIKYTTKQFSCQLRAIEMIVADFEGEQYLKSSSETKPALLLRMLKSLDELLIQALSTALNDSTAFDIVDDEHLKSTLSALARLACMLHVAVMVEDEIRIGMKSPPSGTALFQSFLNKIREIQVRTWCLFYLTSKTGMCQDQSLFQRLDTDLADYLAAMHQVLGLRKSCKSSNKIFLKMMRIELFKLKDIENWEDYIGQVLYDLHGLRLGVGVSDVQDHGCTPENLERRTTIQLAPKVTELARRMPMKDLLKSDLKSTIEHMQGAIGSVKSTPQMVHNLRNYTEYFKKPIHPLRLYQALRGNVELDTVSVNAPETNLAEQRWFSLLGTIALSKYKLVDLSKRQTPGAMDDLRLGATFLRHQLQFTPNDWEVWFRLAECSDYEVEDAVVWSADKMNKERGELIKFQRNAIHCYTIALSKSVGAEVKSEDGDPLHDLYHGFGMRLYSSSREPFAMEPFQHTDHERFFIEGSGEGTFHRVLHNQMQDYKVWKFAAGLFRRAMRRKPNDWRNPYMISKCLWKMYQTPVEALDEKDKHSKPSVEQLVEALEHAVEVVGGLPKSRHADPILEPHYRIFSVVHKLVTRGDLRPQEGADILSRQPLGIQHDEDLSMDNTEDWEEYVITSLRHLRDKDKSNWHHRMIVRHARLLFDEEAQSSNDYVQAKAAFNVLRESMFTKTMVMNVWKCDAERPGRHHVFTEQYVRFMVNLLVVMGDRVSMEALLRRIRKRGGEFYHFNDLWQTCCLAYLKMIRQHYKVQHSLDDQFKSVSVDVFEIMADRISDWASDASIELPAFLGMKEVIEMKRLNGGLMKAASIDDLIADCYTSIYTEVGPKLPGPSPSEIIKERAKLEKTAPAGAEELKPPEPAKTATNPSGGQESGGNDEPSDKQPEAAPRRRAGVRRPDILRKAEQAFIRNLEAPKQGRAGSKSRVGSISSGKRGSATPTGAVAASEDGEPGVDNTLNEGGDDEQDDDTEMKDADDGEDMGDDTMVDAGTAATSPHGSIHDSGDDESDLSDAPEGWDDEPPPSLLFLDEQGEEGETIDEEEEEEAGEEDDEGEEDVGDATHDADGEEAEAHVTAEAEDFEETLGPEDDDDDDDDDDDEEEEEEEEDGDEDEDEQGEEEGEGEGEGEDEDEDEEEEQEEEGEEDEADEDEEEEVDDTVHGSQTEEVEETHVEDEEA